MINTAQEVRLVHGCCLQLFRTGTESMRLGTGKGNSKCVEYSRLEVEMF